MSRSQNSIVQWVGALALFFCSFSYSNAQSPPIINHQFGDDSYVHVPLQFGFPFYGRTFTNSWMHSNGVVSFLDPSAPIEGAGQNPAGWAYCCEGVPMTQGIGAQFNFMIAPLWTDLYPVGQSRFRTQGDSTFQRYHWENIAEISNMNNLNTFGLEIRPSGFIGAYYQNINIQNQNVTAGITGDVRYGQYQQFYHGRGIPAGSLSNWSVTETLADQCVINPLSSPTCAGYTQAMCTTNPLYSTSCAGYQQAYFTQQCSINTLYNVNCPGYAAAYLDYQCSVNALYSTTCLGYEQAYFDQQCSLNSLYNSNCPGYAAAYFDQQCSLDGLYDRTCPNYAEAYAKKNVLTPVKEVEKTTTQTAVETVAAPVVTAAPAVAATAVVPVTPAPEPVTQVAVAETKSEPQAQTSSTESKDKPKTARQELAERRQAAARAKAVEDGKKMAEEVGKAADMEAQIAVQNVVIQAMGFTPGFDAYGKVVLPDAQFYRPFEIYKGQSNIDNPSGRRFMTGSDRLHSEMVDSQYK